MKNGNGTNGVEMPFDEDAERGLICSVLLGGDRVAVELSVPKAAFFSPVHAMVWDTLCDLIVEGKPLAFPVVKHRLSQLEQLEEIGGIEYLNELYGFVPTAEAFRYYSESVLDHWRLRKAINSTTGLLERLTNRGKATWAELRNEMESGLAAMVKDTEDRDLTIKEVTDLWFDELAGRQEKLAREGVAFGLPGLDKTLGMQQPGELVIIGAATSRGKSMLAYQGIAHNAWRREPPIPVGLISLEMTATQTWDRLASHMEQVSMSRFRDGAFDDESIIKIGKFCDRMRSCQTFWFHSGRMDIEAVKNWARRMRLRYGIKLLVVDYLQRVGIPRDLWRASRQEQVSFVSSELKSLALELELVIWCPVQLNKDAEVRESQAIEFDADISIRIELADRAQYKGQIVYNKVRQAERGKPQLVTIDGWYQTIKEREPDKKAAGNRKAENNDDNES